LNEDSFLSWADTALDSLRKLSWTFLKRLAETNVDSDYAE